MRLLLSGGCQAEGVAQALERIAAPAQVLASPLLFSDTYASYRDRILPLLAGQDLIVAGAGQPLQYMRRLLDEAGVAMSVVTIPELHFDAFHPDMAYARRAGTETLEDPSYKSAIAIWLFNRRVAPAIGARAFCAKVYRALGYLDRWPGSVQALKTRFERTDLGRDFTEFFLAVRRRGCFMHTINHPKIHVLEKLAELLARRVGLPIVSPIVGDELPDGLAWEIWPVYPEVAESLGLPDGGYHWRRHVGHRRIDSVVRFLDLAFRDLLNQGIRPGELRLHDYPVRDFDARMASIAREVF